MKILTQDFYERNTLEVAKDLLGKYLIHEINGIKVGGKIVEVEGYTGVKDKAAHAYGGKKTPKIIPMYGIGGTVYIYSIYGMYLCLNAITVGEGDPQGVLIRAIEPLMGIDFMAKARTKKYYNELTNKEILNLTSGPSKLCLALGIAKDLNNTLFWGGELYISEKDKEIERLCELKENKTGEIIHSKRIGVDYAEEAKDYLYRFYYKDNLFVSKKDKK